MINIEDYFEKGYVVSQVPTDILQKLWFEIHMTEWIDDTSGTYKQTPSWYIREKQYDYQEGGDQQNLLERLYGDELTKKAPSSLIDVANSLIDNDFFNPLRMFKESADLMYLHFWNGAEEIPYHFDTIDKSDTLIFLYLTEELEWQQDWGGSISFCKELTTGKYYEKEVLPNNGTMVVVNNSNPLIKHRVRELKNRSVNRYTFSFCYSWK